MATYGTLSVDTITNSGGDTFTVNPGYGSKNKIINGTMQIAQYGSTAVYANTTSTRTYTCVDRWHYQTTIGGKYTLQQSTSAPSGFINSLLVTSTSAYTPATGDALGIGQVIEGVNIADLAWGTTSGKSVTLSFWTQSSVTGFFGGCLINSATNSSYPFYFFCGIANFWQKQTINIPAPPNGTTWLTNNGGGIYLYINMGVGTTYAGAGNVWGTQNCQGAQSTSNIVATNGATFYITGVQLEVGSAATAFDYRPYGTELALCQRYFERSYNIGSATGSFTNGFSGFVTSTTSATDVIPNLRYAVTKRDTPTVVVYNAVSGASGAAYRTSDAASISVSGINYSGTTGVGTFTLASGSIGNYLIHWTASSEL